ncbi:WbqC family protein [Desulfobacula toluolica]|uniref:Conserved uncharacterized protein, WbqC-like n=1 Tax=Desulfobacula toluolica (strain DSM 7467 / Tol2) TaxID=651182 RepID=K0NRV0_DESTT|nr:WbqC family protein [Desulfobacula toluolica]CCK81687.1 conserved uncharacterized protein, WbqC-like [Desulfobacula toluolica Tol2]
MQGCILQPSYLPWLGFFEQFYVSNIFIFLDDVQYTKQDWRNRNKLRTYDPSDKGWTWLTVPVKVIHSKQALSDTPIDYSTNWIAKHLNCMRQNYHTATYFKEIFQILKSVLENKFKYLVELNVQSTIALATYLGLQRDTILSSSLGIKTKDKNERLIQLCKATGITNLFDGKKAKNFLDLHRFKQNGISVSFQNYHHPSYSQCQQPFIKYLSVIDLLFNYGKQSIDIILKNSEFL